MLCFAKRTVSELARHLGTTDNAVREHLAALAQDGLVKQSGRRPGARRPHATYDLTPRGHQLFPKAYGPLLSRFLDVVSEKLPTHSELDLLKEAGARLARAYLGDFESLGPKRRLERLMSVLKPVAELEKKGSQLIIHGCGCPMSALVRSHPELCTLSADLLGDVLGRPVQERCQREGDSPHCCFQIR